MSRKAILITIAIFLGISFTAVSFTENLKIGTDAPAFEVKSGDDEILTLDMIKGKVIVVFYETKDVVEKNRKLKDELRKFYDGQPDTKRVDSDIAHYKLFKCFLAFYRDMEKKTQGEFKESRHNDIWRLGWQNVF